MVHGYDCDGQGAKYSLLTEPWTVSAHLDDGPIDSQAPHADSAPGHSLLRRDIETALQRRVSPGRAGRLVQCKKWSWSDPI